MESLAERLPLVLSQFIPFVMAIVFHEAAHAWVASRHGDFTARNMGRETLNPLPHIDPIGTVLFPLINMITGINILFGWAKPVPVNYNQLKPYRRGLFLVSMAGIAMNILLAFLAAFLLVLLLISPEFYLTKPFVEMCKAAIAINYSLAFFNLIPLPPLDGSKAIQAFLSLKATMKYESIAPYSFFILMGLLLSGVLNVLIYPISFMSELSVQFWIFVFTKLGIGIHVL